MTNPLLATTMTASLTFSAGLAAEPSAGLNMIVKIRECRT